MRTTAITISIKFSFFITNHTREHKSDSSPPQPTSTKDEAKKKKHQRTMRDL